MQKSTINFLGIGVQKAGTSWLHKSLQKHPEIWMPPQKELHYFDRSLTYPSPSYLASDEFSTRINSNSQDNIIFKDRLEKKLKFVLKNGDDKEIKWYLKYFLGTYNDQWYNSLFDEGKDKVSGEITPSYSFLSPKDIEHIHSIYPKLKIILILRNPIDRAWSHIRFFMKRNQFAKDSSLEEIKSFIDSDKQELRGDYLSILHHWSSIFPKEQMHICFYDKIEENPQNFLNKIFNFLEISLLSLEKTILNTKVNISTVKPMPLEIETYLIDKYHNDIEQLANIVGGSAVNWFSKISEKKNG